MSGIPIRADDLSGAPPRSLPAPQLVATGPFDPDADDPLPVFLTLTL